MAFKETTKKFFFLFFLLKIISFPQILLDNICSFIAGISMAIYQWATPSEQSIGLMTHGSTI